MSLCVNKTGPLELNWIEAIEDRSRKKKTKQNQKVVTKFQAKPKASGNDSRNTLFILLITPISQLGALVPIPSTSGASVAPNLPEEDHVIHAPPPRPVVYQLPPPLSLESSNRVHGGRSVASNTTEKLPVSSKSKCFFFFLLDKK